jgi:methyl-accepting chemotaxis protein
MKEDPNSVRKGPTPSTTEIACSHETVAEIRRLLNAVTEGRLDERGDPRNFEGSSAEVVSMINSLLDTLVGPLRLAAGTLDKISRGEIPEFITGDYHGEFDGIKRSVNSFLATMYGMQQETRNVVRAIGEGRLTTRGNEWDFQGIWADLFRGVNDIIDAVTDPLVEPRAVLDKLADYDLCARVTGRYRGEHARIKKALNASTEVLHRALLEVAQATEQVAAVGDRITVTSQTMAEGAINQAQSVQETAGSLQKITAAGRENAQSTQTATVLAGKARESSGQGKASAESLNASMAEIRTAAEATIAVIQEINEITAKTTELAADAGGKAAQVGEAGRSFAVVAQEVRTLAGRFKRTAGQIEEAARGGEASVEKQERTDARRLAGMAEIIREIQKMAIETNMLALNAAVEAAHVAEAGLGFERTAANVRGLAVQSKDAGDRTETVVRRFVALAEEGEERSRQIEGQLAEIVGAVSEVSRISETIATSIGEQQRDMEAVDGSLGKITGVMQQNTDAAKASSDASDMLASQTATLHALLGKFRLEAAEKAVERAAA